MTDVNIDALDALHAKATAGEWRHEECDYTAATIWSDHDGPYPYLIAENVDDRDAASIVALHNAWPAVSAELRALRERVAQLEGALDWYENHDPQAVEAIRQRAALKGRADD